MSTGYQPVGGHTIAEDSLRVWSCVTCRRRKVKCDRRDPCSNCVKGQIECHFPVTGRLPRRRDPTTWRSPTEKQAELLDRLRRLEALVTELAAQVEDGPDKSWSMLPSSLAGVPGVLRSSEVSNGEGERRQVPGWESPVAFGEFMSVMKSHFEGETDEDFGRLVVGHEEGLQIGKAFWSVFCSEVEHIFHAIQDVTSSASDSNLEAVPPNNAYSGLYLGNAQIGSPQVLDDLYPLPSQMLFIWRTYVENVDPFIKVIDVAAVEGIVTNLRGKFDSLKNSLQALLFAVSLAAITSLDEKETVNCFDMPRHQLLARFCLGTERALANAGLLVTKELETIQAFVIYLSLLPHIGAQELTSPLTGLLLRIATSSQLHRDAENTKTLSLTPVEIEMRRRLWWQIVFIDSTTQPVTSGLSASDTKFDTKTPSCVCGGSFDTSMAPLDAQSEPMICIMRCEIWLLCRFLNANQRKPLEQNLQTLHSTWSRLDDSYFVRAPSGDAFASLIKVMALLAFSKVEHTLYLQHFRILKEHSKTPSQEMRRHHLDLSISILEAAHRLRTEPSWRKWRWQLLGDFPWASMGAVFIQLCQSPWSATSERGWALACRVSDEVPDIVKESPSWVRLSKLIVAAEAHRRREKRAATWSTCPHNETCTCSLVKTKEGSNMASIYSTIPSAEAQIQIDSLEFEQVLASGVFDNAVNAEVSNELESLPAFNPTEWQVWDEGLVADDSVWDMEC